MPRRNVPTGRLRRRLTIAFLLTAGVAAGVLAAGSYLLVRQSRLSDSVDRGQRVARFDLVLAAGILPPSPGEDDIQRLKDTFEQQKQDHVILVTANATVASNESFNPPIPEELSVLAGRGQLAYQRVNHEGSHLLLVGGRIPGSTNQLFVVSTEDPIFRDVSQLRNVLMGGWFVVVALAGLVGRLLASRTLEPVARASQAARSMAEGLLATRLPVEGKDEFGAWAASFNEMADALEGKITALSEAQARERRFTSDVSHELRTPLTALVGAASLMQQYLADMPVEARRPAELLIMDVGRLRRLVDELMEISRFDAGRESVESEPVDLRALVDALVRSRSWDGKVDVEGGGVVVGSDRRRLERVVANLVGNALEHGEGAARVRIAADGVRASVDVTDRGPGIAQEHLPHLFDRFYKADPSRSGTGSGLGLAIARENARLLGGDIDARSEPGLGSRFTVWVPVTQQLPRREGDVAPRAQSEGQVPHGSEGVTG